jgi:signal transduction histidine kinase
MGADDSLLTDYRRRSVMVGVAATFIVLAPISVYPFLPGAEVTLRPLYFATVVVGLLGAIAIALLPWRRLLTSSLGMRIFYVWSVADILLISVLVFASGGARSPLWSVYALTTVFFAGSYPPRGQITLLGFTFASYGAAIVVSDVALAGHEATVILNLGVLGVVAFMASFLSSELTDEMRRHAAERRRSHHRATKMARIADAARGVHALETQNVLDAVLDASVDLGYPTAGVALLGPQHDSYRVVAARGLPDQLTKTGGYKGSLTGTLTQSSIVDMPDLPDPVAAEILAEHGLDTAVSAPIHRGGRMVGFLAGARNGDDGAADDVEAFETLAALAGRALENAHLFELKSDFIANVSHELRTPLTIIVGYTHTLLDRGRRLTPELREDLLRRLAKSADRLDGVITGLLDFSVLESGRREIKRHPLDIGRVVHDVVDAHLPLLEPRNVVVDAPDDVTVVGDRNLLERALANLVANAATHTPPTTRVRISVEADSDTTTVTVSDNGPGIPPDEIDQITDRFYRGGEHLTRGRSGLGLGLALADEILTMHDSRLDVSSDVGEGTTFSFTLNRNGASQTDP